MLSKLAVVFVATLAATAQAGHVKHHHFAKRHYSDNSTSVAQLATTVTLVPTPSSSSTSQLGTGVSTVTLVPTLSGASLAHLSTGPGGTVAHSSSATLDHSSFVPLSTGPNATIAYSSSGKLDHSISVPLTTGPSATLVHSSSAQQSALSRTNSIYLSTGPYASLYSSSSLSTSLNPSNSVPLGTGSRSSVTQQATTTGPHGSVVTQVPSKLSIITSDSVLTYTIGSGSSTTVVVTTVRHTSTQTVYQVCIEWKKFLQHLITKQLNRPSMRHPHQPHSKLQMLFLARIVQPLPSALSLRPPPWSRFILLSQALLARTVINWSRHTWSSAPPQLLSLSTGSKLLSQS